MVAVKRDLYIEQGATFSLGFNVYQSGPPDIDGNPTQGDPYDFTGCTARMQIRKRLNSPVLTSVSTEDGDGIVLGTTDGRVDITISDEKTDLITVTTAVYDLEVVYPTDPDKVDRVLQGGIVCNLNVTRDAP